MAGASEVDMCPEANEQGKWMGTQVWIPHIKGDIDHGKNRLVWSIYVLIHMIFYNSHLEINWYPQGFPTRVNYVVESGGPALYILYSAHLPNIM